MAFQRIREFFERSFGAKALAGVVLAVGLTMLASTLYHFFSTSDNAEAALRERGEFLASVLADTLARPLFDYNHTAVASAVEAISANREVGALRVRDTSNLEIAARGNWNSGSEDAISLRREIVLVEGGRSVPVGRLELLIHKRDMQNELREALLRGIFTNALLATAIIVFLLVLAAGARRHFATVLAALDDLREGREPKPIPAASRRDEIGLLAQAVTSFHEAIDRRQAAEAAQQLLQRELQQERERAAKEALDRSQEQYRLVVENVSEGIVVVQEGYTVLANPCVEQLVDAPLATLKARPFLDFVHPDDRAMVRDHHRRRLHGEPIESRYAFRLLGGDARPVWVELSAVLIDWQGKPATLAFIADITQRRQAEDDIRQALEKQRELNALKSRFVSMTSHEFRTPLATILSSIELIKYYGDRLPHGDKEELIANMENAIHRMTRMLDDVLIIGKADAGKLEFKPEAVNIAVLGRRLAEEAARAGAGKESALSRLDFSIDCDDAPRLMDEHLLRHIVGNLVSNALKYSPSESRVAIAISSSKANVCLSVRDEGIGIPSADLPRLFETFHRATNVGNIPGTGLGMTIVSRSVQLHGGEITVESVEGQGSTFRVTLPAPKRGDQPATTEVEHEDHSADR